MNKKSPEKKNSKKVWAQVGGGQEGVPGRGRKLAEGLPVVTYGRCPGQNQGAEGAAPWEQWEQRWLVAGSNSESLGQEKPLRGAHTGGGGAAHIQRPSKPPEMVETMELAVSLNHQLNDYWNSPTCFSIGLCRLP